MSRAENKKGFFQKRDKERRISPQLENSVYRAGKIIERLSISNSTVVDSLLMITLTTDNFEDEIAELPGHIQFAIRVIYEELPDVELRITTNAEHGVELAITDRQVAETVRVIVASSDADKDSIAKKIAPKKFPLSQAKEYLLQERIIVLVSPPRATYEKISRSFLADYARM